MDTKLTSLDFEHSIGPARLTTIIGNRINTDAHPLLAQTLLDGDFSVLRNEAINQLNAGAHVLLLKLNSAGLEEEQLLPQAVKIISEIAQIPVCFSTKNLSALGEALKLYRGKPLFCGLDTDEESLNKFLPQIAKSGVAIIGRPQYESLTKTDLEERIDLARHVLRKCISAGVLRENVLLDLTGISFSDHPDEARLLIESCLRIKRIEDINIVLHIHKLVANLPCPDEYEKSFTALAIMSGVTCLFVEPEKMKGTVERVDRLLRKGASFD